MEATLGSRAGRRGVDFSSRRRRIKKALRAGGSHEICACAHWRHCRRRLSAPFLGFSIAALLAPVLGISSFEGAAGYFAVLIGGPLGALLGLVLGVVLVLRKWGDQGFGAIARPARLGGGRYCACRRRRPGFLYLTQDTVNPNGPAPQLVFEISLPPGAQATAAKRAADPACSQGRKIAMPGPVQREETREDGGRIVVVGLVEMY